MKRFFLYTSLAFILAALSALVFNVPTFAVIIFAVTAAAISVTVIVKYKVKFLYFAVIISALLPIFHIYCLSYRNVNFNAANALCNNRVTICGKITECGNIGTNSATYVVKTSKINLKNLKQNIKIKLTSYGNTDFKAGDEISADVKFKIPETYIYEYYCDGVFVTG